MALQKKRVRRTIVAGVEIESAEEENLVTEAAKWYLQAKQKLLQYAIEKRKERITAPARILKDELKLPEPPHSRLPDELAQVINGVLKALKRRRTEYLRRFQNWWNKVVEVGNQHGLESYRAMKPKVEALISSVPNNPFDPTWDSDIQKRFAEVKEIWSKIRLKDSNERNFRWRYHVPPLVKPPKTPEFKLLGFDAGARVSGGGKAKTLTIKSQDGEIFLRLLLRQPGVSNHGRGSYREIWLHIILEDESRKALLLSDKVQAKFIRLRRRTDKWEAHITVEKEVSFEKPRVIYGIDIGMKDALLFCVPIFIDSQETTETASEGKKLIVVEAGQFWHRLEVEDAQWRKWQFRRSGKAKEGIKGKRMVWRILKRRRRRRREVTKHLIHQIVNALISQLQRPCAVAIERLKGLRNKPHLTDKRSQWKFHRWAYRFLLETLRYKLEWEGIMIIEVPPYGTSQTCPRCSHRDKRSRDGRRFRCTKCKFQHNADAVGAFNIAMRAVEQLQSSRDLQEVSIAESAWKILTGKPMVLKY